MKSTQDLVIFLNKLEQALEITSSSKVLSIEIFADKSFRISEHNGESGVTILYDSEETSLPSGSIELDINDLCYHDPELIATDIKESKQEKKDELDLS